MCNNNNSRYLTGRRVGRGRQDGTRRDRRFYAHNKYFFHFVHNAGLMDALCGRITLINNINLFNNVIMSPW